jgi:hypothetical protein
MRTVSLKTESSADLERSGSGGTEGLEGPLGRLAKGVRLRGRIGAQLIESRTVAPQISDIEGVKHLAKDRKLVPLLENDWLVVG